MIAYFKQQDATVEVPDDISEHDLADIQKNFSSYVQPEQDTAAPKADIPQTTDTLTAWKPNFYEAHIKPALQELGVSDIPLVQNRTPGAHAFVGKAIEGATFGASKPITDVFDQAYKDHPVYSVLGDLTGGVGSLLATGGALGMTKLPAVAAETAAASTKIAAAAPRFVAPAIMTAATFGTNTFIRKTVQAFQDGHVDVADFGGSVIKDTALGALMGGISGLSNTPTAIASAAGLGFVSAKLEGGDDKEAALSAGIWGIFEAVGSFGRDARLRKQALGNLGDTIGEYAAARNPDLTPEQAAGVGQAIVIREAEKVGGVDAIVKSDQEGTLKFIEEMNQKIRNGKVRADVVPTDAGTTTQGEGSKSVRIPGPGEPAAPAPDPTVPPEFKNTNEALAYAQASTPETRDQIIQSLDQRISSRLPGIAEAQKAGDFQGGMNLATANQFDREAKKAMQAQTEAEAAAQAAPAPEAATEQAAPKIPINKKIIDFNEEDKQAMGAVLEDIKGMEALRRSPILDKTGQGPGEVIGQTVSGYVPEYLKNIGVTKASEIPIFEKALKGEPLTQKQHDRVVELVQRWYDEQERIYGKSIEELKAQVSEPEATEAIRSANADEPPPAPENGPTQEAGAVGSTDFPFGENQSGGTYNENYQSTKGAGRQYGNVGDEMASLEKAIGGIEYIKKLKGPELVKLAKEISGDVPLVRNLLRSLGQFRPADQSIKLDAALFSDQRLWEAVLAHEIGHLIDYQPGTQRTMSRGNILGRIASLGDYRKSLLPESPQSTEKILTDEDRRRFRSEAEKIARARAEGTPAKPEPTDNKFEPQAILDVWNNATANIDQDLLDYIKGLSTDSKKSIIKAAMSALKTGEKVEINDVKRFNKEAQADPTKVADIYRDLIKKEIKKRKLWENEVISEEFKKLSMYWKPFDPVANEAYRAYRFSSPELYADFISVLLNAPAKAKEIAPDGYKAFFNYLETKPEVMKALLELQALVQADDVDLQKVRGEDILAMFERGEDAFIQRQSDLEAAQKSTWDKLRVIVWDKNSILLDERNKLKKKGPLPAAQDGQYAIEKNSMMSVFVKSHLEDFDRLVYKPAKDADVLNDLKTVLFLDRVGADRGELANPLGHTPETAQAFLANLEKSDPIKFQAVMKLADQARGWFRGISQIPGAEDFWTKEQIFTMGLNDKYAPFRVVDYMRDYVSSGFASQMGTFKDIGDPLTSLAMKGISVTTAIERNRLKKIVGEMLLRSGLEMKPAEVTQTPGNFKIQEPAESYLGTLAWKDGGKWVAYHLDKYIADAFNTAATEKIGQIGGVINTIFANNFFRATFITFNAGFQSVNLIRDFMATWKARPEMKIGQMFRLYVDSLPTAKARAKGAYDPLIQEMERAGALQLTLNDLLLGKTGEDQELEAILQKFDIIESPTSKYEGVPVIEQITKILDWLRYTGDTIETLPKVVGWIPLDNMPVEKRAYVVRNLMGTPNPKRAGMGAPVMNSILLFSNIFKEGFRGLIEKGFTGDEGKKSYWIKTFESSIMPRIIMGMAAAGFFGAGVKAVMDKASEYHKTNYIVIPMGVDEQGNGVYITIPQDEDGRLIGGLFWKMLNHDGNAIQNLSDILAFGAGNFPGVAPGPTIAAAWVEFLSGGNPRDTFRQQDILTEQERAAGGAYAFEPMVRWTMNETGLVRLDVRDKLRDEPLHKTIIGSIPILNRFVRITRQGEREIARDAAQGVKQQEARQSLDIKDQARDAIRQGKSVNDFIEKAPDRDTAQKMMEAYNNIKKGFTSDPRVQALNSATSNEQKIAILHKVSGDFEDKGKFNDFVDELYANKIISARVALEVRY